MMIHLFRGERDPRHESKRRREILELKHAVQVSVDDLQPLSFRNSAAISCSESFVAAMKASRRLSRPLSAQSMLGKRAQPPGD